MAYGGVAPNAFTSGSPTLFKCVATACREKGSSTYPSAPTAARFTACFVWLSTKNSATRGSLDASTVVVSPAGLNTFAVAAFQVGATGAAFRTCRGVGSPSTSIAPSSVSPSASCGVATVVAPWGSTTSIVRSLVTASRSVVAGPP